MTTQLLLMDTHLVHSLLHVCQLLGQRAHLLLAHVRGYAAAITNNTAAFTTAATLASMHRAASACGTEQATCHRGRILAAASRTEAAAASSEAFVAAATLARHASHHARHIALNASQ